MQLEEQAFNILIAMLTGLIYSVWAYVNSKETFDSKKFMKSMALQFLVSLGFSFVPILGDTYTLPFDSTVVSQAIGKLLSGLKKKKEGQ